MAIVSNTSDSALAGLSATFTHMQALRSGLSERALYRLRDAGSIELIARGLYRRADVPLADLDLVEVAVRAPDATLCLLSALARHDLTDEIPAMIDVALPRGRHRPKTVAPVAWHTFDPDTFDVGRDDLEVDPDLVIGIYNPERCIVDAIRMRHRDGPETATSAIKRWLRRPGTSPARLLAMARQFPQAEPELRRILEILL